MTEDDISGQETDDVAQPAHRNDLAAAATEKTLKRARWELLRLAACPGANRVNVRNASYGDEASEHTYTVTIGPDGLPTDCTCPAAEYQPGPCKHAVAVADAPEVVADAMHGDAPERAEDDESPPLGPDTDVTTMADLLREDGRLVATDGGQLIDEESTDKSDEACDECGLPLADAHDQPAGYVEECVDGEVICGACADIRYDRYRGDGRLTLTELEERAVEPVIEPEVRADGGRR